MLPVRLQILEENANVVFYTSLHSRKSPAYVAAGGTRRPWGPAYPVSTSRAPRMRHASSRARLQWGGDPSPACRMSCGRRNEGGVLHAPAERGDLAVLQLVHVAAERAVPDSRLALDAIGHRLHTPLMAACASG